MTTLPDFHSDVTKFFLNAWNKRTPVALDNKKFSVPQNKPWVRFTVIDNTGSNASLGGSSTLYRDMGFISIQLFYPNDSKSGTREFNNLADAAKKIFRGEQVGGGWFRNCSVRSAPDDDPWLVKNISCEYIFDEIS